jgi:hypothetical protein
MHQLRIFNPDELADPAPRREPRRPLRGGAARWLHGALVDVLAMVVVLLASSHAFGQSPPVADGCYTDPITGKQYCTLPKSTAPAEPIPAGQVVAATHVAGLPPNAEASDVGTCTLIYDDGQVARVLTCFHNIRDSSGPFTIKLSTGRALSATVIATDEVYDLAALELAGGNGIIPIQIDDGPLPDEVCGSGFGSTASGEQFQTVRGPVTATVYGPKETAVGWRGFAGQMRRGDSGGTVRNTKNGRLVGVIWGSDPKRNEVMFCCGQPLRRFLDRVLPGRPGVVIPHAQYTPLIRLPSPTPPPNMPAARPPAPVTHPPTSAPAGTNPQQGDGLGTSLVSKALIFAGLPLGGAAIAAPIVWWLLKRGGKKEAQRIKDRLAPKQAGSSTDGGAALPAPIRRRRRFTSPRPRPAASSSSVIRAKLKHFINFADSRDVIRYKTQLEAALSKTSSRTMPRAEVTRSVRSTLAICNTSSSKSSTKSVRPN